MHAHICGEQGQVVSGFAPANKCTVKARKGGSVEYDPHIKHGFTASSKVPVVASLSVHQGDSFTVVQMGTIGVEGSVRQQLAVLVLVRSPSHQSQARHEVFTVEQLRPVLMTVAWMRSGLPAMEEAKVSLCTAAPCANLSACVSCHGRVCSCRD